MTDAEAQLFCETCGAALPWTWERCGGCGAQRESPAAPVRAQRPPAEERGSARHGYERMPIDEGEHLELDERALAHAFGSSDDAPDLSDVLAAELDRTSGLAPGVEPSPIPRSRTPSAIAPIREPALPPRRTAPRPAVQPAEEPASAPPRRRTAAPGVQGQVRGLGIAKGFELFLAGVLILQALRSDLIPPLSATLASVWRHGIAADTGRQLAGGALPWLSFWAMTWLELRRLERGTGHPLPRQPARVTAMLLIPAALLWGWRRIDEDVGAAVLRGTGDEGFPRWLRAWFRIGAAGVCLGVLGAVLFGGEAAHGALPADALAALVLAARLGHLGARGAGIRAAVARPRRNANPHGPATELPETRDRGSAPVCPDCRAEALMRVRLGPCELRCQHCGGAALEPEQVKSLLLRLRVPEATYAQICRDAERPVAAAPCLSCGAPTRPFQLRGERARVCERCRQLWLCRGGLARLFGDRGETLPEETRSLSRVHRWPAVLLALMGSAAPFAAPPLLAWLGQ